MSTGPVLKYLHLNTHWTFEFSHFRHGDGSEKVWQVLIHSPNYQFKHQTFSSIELRNVAIKKGNPTIKKRELKDWKGMSESDSGIYLYMKSNEDTPEDWQIIPVLKVMWPRRHTRQPWPRVPHLASKRSLCTGRCCLKVQTWSGHIAVFRWVRCERCLGC
jgi:hypothetical protein